MPALTRRRYPERQDCRHVYYGDVHVGVITVRTGVPHDEDHWPERAWYSSSAMSARCMSLRKAVAAPSLPAGVPTMVQSQFNFPSAPFLLCYL
jgi:hypothetical protein